MLGPWSVEPSRNVISRDGEERHLENRLMQTLVFLARHPGQTLSREQFFDSVWEGRVVNEEALSRAISLLRSVLDDNAQSPQFIKTVPGVGYQLIAYLHHVEAGVFFIDEVCRLSKGRWGLTDRGHEETVFNLPVGKNQNHQSAIGRQRNELDVFDGRFVFWSQNKARPLG